MKLLSVFGIIAASVSPIGGGGSALTTFTVDDVEKENGSTTKKINGTSAVVIAGTNGATIEDLVGHDSLAEGDNVIDFTVRAADGITTLAVSITVHVLEFLPSLSTFGIDSESATKTSVRAIFDEVAGNLDDFSIQIWIQVSGGDWSTPLYGLGALLNELFYDLGGLTPGGNYDVRARVVSDFESGEWMDAEFPATTLSPEIGYALQVGSAPPIPGAGGDTFFIPFALDSVIVTAMFGGSISNEVNLSSIPVGDTVGEFDVTDSTGAPTDHRIVNLHRYDETDTYPQIMLYDFRGLTGADFITMGEGLYVYVTRADGNYYPVWFCVASGETEPTFADPPPGSAFAAIQVDFTSEYSPTEMADAFGAALSGIGGTTFQREGVVRAMDSTNGPHPTGYVNTAPVPVAIALEGVAA